MAVYTNINGDFAVLRSVLTNSGFFDTVETGSFSLGGHSFNGVICGADEKSGFFMYGKYNDVNAGNIYGLAVNRGAVASYEFQPGYTANQKTDYFPVSVYVMPNGVSIICSRARILITRNQKGKVVVVTGANPAKSDSTTNYIMGAISAIATTDDETFWSYTINTQVGHQTYIMPIGTMSSSLSYTDKAGVLAYKQNTVIGDIIYGNKRYFADGYFAIEDAQSG